VWIEQTRYKLLKALSSSKKRISKPAPHSEYPKRPLAASIRFSVDMYRASEAEQQRVLGSSLAGMAFTDRAKLIFNAFKELPSAEKEVCLFISFHASKSLF
jgi:hypothetical protein